MGFGTVENMPEAPSKPTSTLSAPPMPVTSDRWALFLDVDGTLLEFNDDPQAVKAPPALLALLHDLHRTLDGALALVSGRGLDDINRIFGQTSWAVAGLHGLELRHADGSFRRNDVTAAQRTRMREAVHALAERFDGIQLEDKQRAIALHCRNDSEGLATLRHAAEALMPELPGYELQPGRQVLEFKPAGMDKGEAVRELLMNAPFADRKPVYLGDDLTDEHAFKSINQAHGMSVRVGDREPSLAHYTLAGPAAAVAWLQRVLDALAHGTQSHAGISDQEPSRQP